MHRTEADLEVQENNRNDSNAVCFGTYGIFVYEECYYGVVFDGIVGVYQKNL